MPKISNLPPALNLASDDEVPVVDVSATDTKKMTVGKLLSFIYPIGSIYTNATDNTNPATLLGFGTWEAFAQGRVPVGVDPAQTEFDTPMETGGAKTHTLAQSEIPNFTGTFMHVAGTENASSGIITNQGGYAGVVEGNAGGVAVGTRRRINFGSGGAHNNLQPYITVYMWRRTA